MKPILDYQKTDMLDIIFDGKNKSYGAYVLRREYPSTLKKSILGALLVFGFFIGIPILFKYISLSRAPEEIIRTVTISLANFRTEKAKIDKEVKIKPEKSKLPKPPSTKVTPPVIVEDFKVKDLVPTNENIKTNTGIETIIATNTTEYMPDNPNKNIVEPIKIQNEVLNYSEQLPSFPGGYEALMKYLSEHIKYPRMARENGIEGKVLLSFVVDIDGMINDIKVVRSVGGGCDEESIKVIKSMPRWKPGKQNGQTVNVKYNLPINFKLN